ncbi:MAG: LiaF-related protein [Anaerolineales bacterium]|nr:LiaF-related protein [Anaerolineales bacterium]
MENNYRRPSIAGPVILIALGVIFLLNNLGLIELNVWDVVMRFWPILLIAVGLDIFIGNRSAWGAAITLVVVLAILAGGIIFFDKQPRWTYEPENIEIPLGSVEHAAVTLGPALGYLHVGVLPKGSNVLVQGEVRPFSGEEITETVDFSATRATIELRTKGVIVVPFVGGWNSQPSWEIALHPGVATDMIVDFGIGKAELDLRDLLIGEIHVEHGIGQTILLLPSADNMDINLEGGIGEIRVVIPDDVGVRLRADVGIGNVQVPSGYTRDGDFYLSPGYAAAENQIEMVIDLGIGSVQVR